MKRFLRNLGIVTLGIVVLLVLVVVFLNFRTSTRMEQRFDIEPVLTTVTPDSAMLARGRHVMEIEACRHCHGEKLAGKVMMDMPLWRMTAPNLTSGRGGIGGDYTVADWDRAIRSGVAADGRALMIMPGEVYKNLSDEDAAALIAYLQTIEPVDNELPGRELRFLGAVMLGAGGFDPSEIVHEPGSAPKTTPAHEPTLELGGYLASTSCIGCHGQDFSGKEAEDPNCPPSPPLDASAAWELNEFVNAIRTGVNPGGRELNDQCMPWSAFSRMTDTELEALYKYIRTETGVAG